MKLDLSRFRTGEEHLDRRYEPSDFASGGEEFRIAAPVVFTADVRKDAEKVRLVGRVTTTLECDCSRCLEPFTVPIDAAFDLLFLPVAAAAGEGDREMADDDVGVTYYEDDVIDLGNVMREQFYLAMPMKPLCREDCRGLCPVCGINRNRETCTCQTDWVDPRMEPLKKLRDRNA